MIKDLENMISNHFTYVKAEEIISFCKNNKVFEFTADILKGEEALEDRIEELEDEVEELEDEKKYFEKRIATLEKRNKILLKIRK
jgi:hypothetical protein